MGSGIALACAKGGSHVKVWDIQDEATALALIKVRSALDTLVESNLMTENDAESSLQCITVTNQMVEAVKDAELIFEVIPENLALKKRIFRKLDSICGHEVILASNTSTFKIATLASATKAQDRVIGTHWMNPPYLLRLVEVIPNAKTSNEAVDTVRTFLASIGKQAILCKDTPGFLINRMHSALLVEVISIVEQGIATVQDIDKAWTQFLGPRYCVVGPFQLMDSFGLDTELSQYSYLHKTVKHSKFKPPRLLKRKVRRKQLGLKTGEGFYDYSEKNVQSIIAERDRRFIRLIQFLNERITRS